MKSWNVYKGSFRFQMPPTQNTEKLSNMFLLGKGVYRL